MEKINGYEMKLNPFVYTPLNPKPKSRSVSLHTWFWQ